MTAIAVDDNSLSLDYLETILETTSQFSKIVKFSNAQDALDWLYDNSAEVAFLDIEMSGMNGLALAAEVRKMRSECKVIFVTSNPKYAIEAFQMHVSGYIVKPVTKEAILKELDFIKQNSVPAKAQKKQVQGPSKLQVNCFGNFDVFYNGEALKFTRSKTKELLAYLVLKKGTNCSLGEVAANLYEEREDTPALQSQLRNLVADLNKTLETVGMSELLVKTRGFVSIKTALLECDYYDFLNGDPNAVNAYCGEFMSQYSWAEFTLGYLERNL